MQYRPPNDTDWGLTERGFRRPEYNDILDAWEVRARELFGEKANLTVRSPLGMFIRIFSWFGSLLFQTLEDIYNSRFIDTAIGASLYNLGRFIGLHLLPAQRASGQLLITGKPGTIIPAGWLASNLEGTQYVTLSRVIIDAKGAATVTARAVLPGPDSNARAKTITRIVNPAIPSGIESVINPNAFTGGRERETDEEFRDRYYKSVDFAGGVNIDAIVAGVLQNTLGVLSAVGFENCTDFTDANGLPPHSIEVIVFGGIDEEIGRSIFRRKAAGIQTHGNTETIVEGVNSLLYTIKFSRPQPVYVWFKVWGLEVDPERFPIDGEDMIKIALSAYIGGTGATGLPIGSTVFYKRL
ncbi:phage baseplate protein [Clostridia bacterium]|nr:phage baseplate protein [Clostridia bacterium]